MSRVLAIAVFVVIFIVGLSVLIYPAVSDYYNSQRHVRTVEQYSKAVENLSERDYTGYLEAAREYNEGLSRKPNRFIMSQEEMDEYMGLLDPSGLGVMGMLEIEVINIRLPIYHGTGEGSLQAGLGHLEGSSLPVGGPGTHAVITGHRGLPSSTLLTNMDRVIIGDKFSVTVLSEKLTYRVDQIVTVLPNETSALAIVSGADYCTLVTCTPIGINTHRLLVRGHRVDNDEDDASYKGPTRIISDARVLKGARASLLLIVPAILVILAKLFIRLRKTYGRGKKL
ncbi:MAG: class C sortase [Oscillospiraceae bacterium]|nr:class C sortase [Oscillospiraceae bacterium]